MKVVIFDLDGTIIDSQKGVTNCVKYALQSIGIDEKDMVKLRKFIGPPLVDSFIEYYGFSKEKAKKMVEKYRERYQTIGLLECELYQDTQQTLKSLKEKGYVISLGSSKPENYCKEILNHFKLTSYFDEIVGAQLHGARNEKADVLKEVIKRLNIQNLKDATLVGDTKFDAIGAQEVGIDCLGVSYGFGTEEDLQSNHVIKVVHSMKEVDDYFEK